MIQLKRINQLEELKNFSGEKRIEKELKLLEAKRLQLKEGKKKPKLSTIWRAAKDLLKKESSDKCAYCEEEIESYNIDHFRPTSKYWWLAYCYENWIYSCVVCNRDMKSDHFPINTKHKLKGPTVSAVMNSEQLMKLSGTFAPDPLDRNAELSLANFHQLCHQEEPKLIHPYLDSPESFFQWKADPYLKRVELIPTSNLTETELERFEKSELHYGLNRDLLKKKRYQTYLQLRHQKGYLNTCNRLLQQTEDGNLNITEAAALLENLFITKAPTLDWPILLKKATEKTEHNLKEMVDQNFEFAAMNRYFVFQEWKLTGLEL